MFDVSLDSVLFNVTITVFIFTTMGILLAFVYYASAEILSSLKSRRTLWVISFMFCSAAIAFLVFNGHNPFEASNIKQGIEKAFIIFIISSAVILGTISCIGTWQRFFKTDSKIAQPTH